ncbi:MAG: cell division protein ZapA [bacterium]|nr:cell division protein ZapA [bacterium]
MANEHKAEVEIFGSVYTIKGDEDPEYIIRLTNYVDREMRSITEKTSTVSTTKVAILTAINITDRLFKIKNTVEEKVSELIKKIDAKLEKR